VRWRVCAYHDFGLIGFVCLWVRGGDEWTFLSFWFERVGKYKDVREFGRGVGRRHINATV
jgi:hypothetical protein